MPTNYVANDEVMPTEVVFENGRKVSVVLDSQTGAPILEIGWGEYPVKSHLLQITTKSQSNLTLLDRRDNMKCEEFYQKADKLRSDGPEEADGIDALCCDWLDQYCKEMGKEGQVAKKLITVVKDLLEIR